MAVNRSPNDVGVLQKALDVLEAVVGNAPVSMAEATRATGLGKAAVYRILNTFEARRYLAKDPVTRRYRTGPALLALAANVVDAVDIVQLARAPMTALRDQFGETVNLGVLVGDRVEYVAVVESSHNLRMASRPGSTDHLHSTALGKAILAWLPSHVGQSLLEGAGFDPATPNTLTNWAALHADLNRTHQRGWAIDEEENELGARCIAAPVLGAGERPVAAISVSGPASRMTPDKVLRIADELRRIAGDLSAVVSSVDRQVAAPTAINQH